MARKVVILGVGNLLASDEGVGVHVLVALEQRYRFPDTVRCLDGGVSTHELLDDIGDVDELIVLDAVAADATPASLVHLEGEAARAVFSRGASAHQRSVADLLATLAVLGRSPQRVLLIGVQPAVTALDLKLSTQVAGRVDDLCHEVESELTGPGPHSPRTPHDGAALLEDPVHDPAHPADPLGRGCQRLLRLRRGLHPVL